MKRAKKIAGILLAIALVFSLVAVAFAADPTTTITLEKADGTAATSNYSAYKLLNATNSHTTTGEGEDATTVQHWAYTVNEKYSSVILGVMNTGLAEDATPFTEADIVSYIGELDADGIRAFADAVYVAIVEAELDADETIENNNVFEVIPQGYYLIAETLPSPLPEGNQEVVSLVMLDTAGDEAIEITVKEDVPEVVKKVKDINDSTETELSAWQDSADYDILDTIPYRIYGTVSSKIANYDAYYYKFADKMTKLTYVSEETPVKVYKFPASVDVDTATYENAASLAGVVDITESFTIAWNANEKLLTLECEDLKSITNTTIAGTDKIVVFYYATLDSDAFIGYTGNPNEVTLEYSNNPYNEGDGHNITPKDINIVFTFKGIVNKVDTEGKALEGAGFTLYKWVKNGVATEVDGEITYEDGYVAVGAERTGVTTFEFIGLDDGQYKLVETTVPEGYNRADDIFFSIVATHEVEADMPELTSLTVVGLDNADLSGMFTVATTEVAGETEYVGTISTKVVNTTGNELPSTGGIGTTIFYIVGGILVAGACILLITRRRLNYNR